MNSRKTVIRFFTIADYEAEEVWLHNQHKNGWKLSRMIPPCFYIFEKCTPENMAYRLDYKNNAETSNYFQIFRDYFSDNESRIDMINRVVKTRLLPILVIFLCCVLPNFFRSIETSDPLTAVFTIFFAVMTLSYLYLLIYCGLKLRKLRKKYGNN